MLKIIGVERIPEVKESDDLVGLLLDALYKMNLSLEDDDIIVFSSKIISKSEGMVVDLDDVEVTEVAKVLAKKTGKDERVVQLICDEANEIVKVGRDFILTETRHGFVCANSGVDESNVGLGKAILLPRFAKDSARSLRNEIFRRTSIFTPVLISDSVGRAFRDGIIGTCIGISGISPILDRRGEIDRFGKKVKITKVGIADELCAAANLVMGEFLEGVPIAIIRGLRLERCESDLPMLFPRRNDVFRCNP